MQHLQIASILCLNSRNILSHLFCKTFPGFRCASCLSISQHFPHDFTSNCRLACNAVDLVGCQPAECSFIGDNGQHQQPVSGVTPHLLISKDHDCQPAEEKGRFPCVLVISLGLMWVGSGRFSLRWPHQHAGGQTSGWETHAKKEGHFLAVCVCVRAFLPSNMRGAERTLQESLALHQIGGASYSWHLEWKLPVYRAPLLSLKADKNRSPCRKTGGDLISWGCLPKKRYHPKLSCFLAIRVRGSAFLFFFLLGCSKYTQEASNFCCTSAHIFKR